MGTNYAYYKTRMTWFLKSTDFDLWDVHENGHVPIKLENGMVVSTQGKNRINLIKRKLNWIRKPFISYMHCVINRDEYTCVCQCELTKDI